MNIKEKIKSMGLGVKVALTTMLLIGSLFTIYSITLTQATKKVSKEQSLKELDNMTNAVVGTIKTFDETMIHQTTRLDENLLKMYSEEFILDEENKIDINGKSTPTLKNGDTVLNMNFEKVDNFTATSNATATIFVKDKKGFVRISTSLKDLNNKKVIGTVLDSTHPAYEKLSNGESFHGLVDMFGKTYATTYMPIKNKTGETIGAMSVALDVSKEMKKLSENINSIKIGKTGYVFVLIGDKKDPNYGTVVIHPVIPGKNLLEMKDANGHFFVKEMLEKRNGDIIYPWQNKERNETSPKDKIVVFREYNNLKWIIGSGTYISEITEDTEHVYNIFALIGIFVLSIAAFILYFIMKKMITKPLQEIQVAANRLAQGDLTTVLSTTRKDEIGQLYNAMNGISSGLAQLIDNIRLGTENIKSASSEIAIGNNDLSNRTESQAASLEETATSMEELTTTIKNNAGQAKEASTLMNTASSFAVEGGEAMDKVTENMSTIKNSSQKIVDIISVIDSIAFQTNILALNAAVEAARAGEQGRGFAVVATEVRNLAHRSATAAKEIKDLINSSVDNIQKGNELVKGAETTMKNIVSSITHVSEIMKSIALANYEQSVGVEQINEAVNQMDSVTQQNAALVEEAAAAAMSLQEQASSLNEAISVFKTH